MIQKAAKDNKGLNHKPKIKRVKDGTAKVIIELVVFIS